ncbi:MAG: SusE domain-containing protein [Bacteroidetes bacterium]|nr:SusE domain-containing protein [Bacteroidota bacterium]
MKKIIQNIITLSLVVASLASCKKDENRVNYLGASKPELSASTAGPILLTKATALQHAVTFSWTNPEYQFTTGISSQDVTYYLQFDLAGANFGTPDNTSDIIISKDLGIDLNDSVLNRSLAHIGLNGLEVDVPHDIEVRIKAVLRNDNLPVYSDPIRINGVTPYLDVAVPVPTTGNLYLVGSASPGGWSNPIPSANLAEQTFTQVDVTKYELTVNLTGGQYYLLLPENGSWSNKYAVHDNTAAGYKTTGEFGYNGGNSFYNADIPGPDDSGLYKLTFDFKTGKYTVEKQ